MADLGDVRAIFEAAYPTKSAVETRAALVAIRERAQVVRAESLAASAWAPGKQNQNCVQAVEAMAVLERLITDDFIPWCDDQIAENGGTAPDSGYLTWVWDSIGLQADPKTGFKIFTPLFLAPDYYANACGVEIAAFKQAAAALPGYVYEEAKKVAERAASAVRFGLPFAAAIVVGLVLLRRTN